MSWDAMLGEAERLSGRKSTNGARTSDAGEEERQRAYGTPEEDAAPLAFVTAADLHGRPVPDREWHVAELIPSRTVTLLTGDGGTGKSLLALQLAVATAAGRQWLRRGIERPGPAMFVSAEDDLAEIHRRSVDVTAAEGMSLVDLDRLHIRSLAGEDALLAMLDRRSNALAETPLMRALDAAMAAIRPVVLALDTAADLHSGDENVRSHARQFCGMLRGLAIKHDCAVVLLAHPSLTGMSSGSGLSGSTAWNASVRSRLYLERIREGDFEPDPDARRLSIKKANYGRTGAEIGLRWRGGVFVADRPEGGGLDRMAATAKAQRVFADLLRRFTSEGRFVSASPGPTYAPAVFAGLADAEGCTKRALKAAMDELFRAGRIVNATHGSGAKARSHIAEAAPCKG